VLCHGCRQTPEEFAQGTRAVDLADRTGCVVLLPRQKDTANPWRCWNWFEQRTMRGKGEAAIVAAQIRRVCRIYRIDRKRILVAGISAGGALAAIMGVRYPRLVSAVAVHSGLACGAAASAMTAIGVMQRGPDQDVAQIGADARAHESGHVRVPLLAIHGDRDPVVSPRNAEALVAQYLRLNGYPASADPASSALPAADAEQHATLPDGRSETVREWRRDGKLVVRHVEVGGLGHAWSGGDASLKYDEAGPPDATALVGGFFADAVS
jgi:poly(hydroxyalkanoate) depolymerase family esterase